MSTLIFTIMCAIYDNGKRFVDHTTRFLFRVLCISIFSVVEEGNFFINMALNTAIFYLVFDYYLNYLEGRKWNYIGSTSKIDKWWNKYGEWKSQLVFKILLVLITFNLEFLINLIIKTFT